MPKTFDPTGILQKALVDLNCNGALLAVSENGAINTYSAGSISADEHDCPYYIYSISKTFTATAVMKLCEDTGDFLDDSFSSYFPDTPIPHEITVRQLLNHTGGLSDYFTSPDYQLALKEHPKEPWGYDKLMEFGLEKTPLFKPGSGWAYSNPGYGLLRELISLKSGMDFYEYLSKTIFKEANLGATKPFLKPDYKRLLLEGEDDTFIGDFRPQYSPDWILTGCLISTVSDVARFYDCLFRGGIISQDSLSEMTTTVNVLPDPPQQSIPTYGLGLIHFKKSPLSDHYGHGGGGPGYTTYATHYPNVVGNSVSISLVLNRSLPQTPFSLGDDIISHYTDSQNTIAEQDSAHQSTTAP